MLSDPTGRCPECGPNPLGWIGLSDWFDDGIDKAEEELKDPQAEHWHALLDLMGQVPGAGEPVDGVNAAWYALAGDYANASISCAGMFPFFGNGPTGARLLGRFAKARRAANAAPEVRQILLRSPRSLQAKFKHAGDFGVAGTYSRANAAEFSAAINQHINSAGTRAIQGTYRGQPVTHYLDSSTGLNVISRNGEFVSGWRLSRDQLANVLRNGSLGGG